MIDWAAKIRFAVELQKIIDRGAKYLWGGASSESEGLDCSGFLFLAASRAGLPVTRTSSLRMAQGHNGWAGENIKIEDAEIMDIPFFTFAGQVNRPMGHCGALFKDKLGNLTLAHASSAKQRLVVVPLAGTLLRDLTLVRRL